MNTDDRPVPPRNTHINKPNGPFLFQLGRVVATPAALAVLERHGVGSFALLNRHQKGDWGDLNAHDRAANEAALKDGSRILSAYMVKGDRIWVITEGEAVGEDGVTRASTCILLPEDY